MMSMSLTWIAIIASLLMGVGALLIFILAVKKDYFRDLEETKYQVFWSDIEDLVESVEPQSARPSVPERLLQEDHDGSG
ncbi:MAG: cbb3-type cytochrome oxidase assembly protein [Acidobacteria bacterium]|nr:cbb3-type cytochrome oxidase assembly protein [Acidobacteriota bacterium]MBI3424736.1 cbb3-type cytochrome oxidase assembly protein [Acidobacteriota bacterium]